MFYHEAYAPLLLRLLNDVEKNAGTQTDRDIVDHRLTVHADWNLGNLLLRVSNAGKQHVAMSF